MSRIPVNSKFRTCANCVYWSGERTPEPFFHRFVVDPSTKGKCCSKARYNAYMPMNATCPNFEAHPIVKQ